MMHWQYTPYILPSLIATAISTALALYVWRRRSVPGATSFILFMLAVADWSLGHALELGSADLPSKIFWGKVQYPGVAFLPVAWLAFVLQYTGREKWLTRRNLALLTIEPLIMLLLVWSDDVYGLVYSSIELNTNGPFATLDLTFGPWFWIDVAYSYLLLLAGSLLLLQLLLRSPHLYRGQASALLIGTLAPWVATVLSIAGLTPFPGMDLTPFAFTLSGVALTQGLFRYRLLDIMPVARRAVVDGLGDGVIVLDAQDRIVDLNPAAQGIISRPAAEAIGQPFAQVLSGRPDWVERYRDVTEAHAEIVLGEGEAQRYYDLRISPLYDRRGHLTGRLVVLRDITKRKWAEDEIRKLNEELEQRVIERTAELRKSERRYRLLAENVTDVIFTMDMNLRVTYVSPSVTNLRGYSVEEAMAQTVEELLTPASLEVAMKAFAEELATGNTEQRGPFGSRTLGLEISHRDGSTVWTEVKLAFLRDPDGRAVGILGVARDIAERKQAEEQIRASLKEKEVLLKEIHHRVKNNLQVVSSLLYLQSKRTKDQQALKILHDSQNRVGSMALVHEMLYQSPDLARVDFAEYVRTLANYLFHSYGVNPNTVELKINVDDVFLGVDTAVPCGLIVNELASNCLKHAFPDGRPGEIRIELRSDCDGQFTLLVGDNGVGLPKDLDFRNTSSLGLQLVNTLVSQLDGTIELERRDGTEFKITVAAP
jgi:PAS domain S-box-containing protein